MLEFRVPAFYPGGSTRIPKIIWALFGPDLSGLTRAIRLVRPGPRSIYFLS